MTKNNNLSKTSSTFSPNVAGVQTPTGRVYCPECATKRKVEVVETYLKGDYSEWCITCEGCEDTILDRSDREEDED